MKRSILHPGTQLLREAMEPLPCFLPSKPRHRHTRRPCPSPLAGPEPFPTVPPSPPAPCEPPPTPHRPRQRQRGTDSSAPPETGLPVLPAPQSSGSSLLLFLPPVTAGWSRVPRQPRPVRSGAPGEARPVPRGLRGRCTHRRSGRCRWRMAQKARPSRKEALRSRISTPWYPSHCWRHQACRAPRGPDMGAAAPAAPAAAAAAATSPGAGPPGVGPRGREGRGLQGAGSPRARSPGPAGPGRGPVLSSGARRAAPRCLPARSLARGGRRSPSPRWQRQTPSSWSGRWETREGRGCRSPLKKEPGCSREQGQTPGAVCLQVRQQVVETHQLHGSPQSREG